MERLPKRPFYKTSYNVVKWPNTTSERVSQNVLQLKKEKKVIAAGAQSHDFHGFRDYKARIVLHKHW